MVEQIEIVLKPRSRGFHLVTDEILRHRAITSYDVLCLFIYQTNVIRREILC